MIDADKLLQVVILIQVLIQTDLGRHWNISVVSGAGVKVVKAGYTDNPTSTRDFFNKLVGHIARVVDKRPHICMRTDHRNAVRHIKSVKRGLFPRVPANVEHNVLSVNFFDQPPSSARKADCWIKGAAAEGVGRVVHQTAYSKPQFTIRP